MKAGGPATTALIVEICAVTLSASMFLHGITAAPHMCAYERVCQATQGDPSAAEAMDLAEMPMRTTAMD